MFTLVLECVVGIIRARQEMTGCKGLQKANALAVPVGSISGNAGRPVLDVLPSGDAGRLYDGALPCRRVQGSGRRKGAIASALDLLCHFCPGNTYSCHCLSFLSQKGRYELFKESFYAYHLFSYYRDPTSVPCLQFSKYACRL